MTKKLPLTQGKFAIVDDDVYEWASQYKWRALRGYSTFYAVRKTGIWPIRKDSYLHREIMIAKSNLTVDHVNHNGLDCRRANMRLCTQAENTRNRRRSSRNKSGFKGVHWDSGRDRWRAEIYIDGKRIYLGSFVAPEDAARAYDEAAHKHHGEFAKTNF